MAKNMGYGICGAKNSFSGGALLDNWVEDSIGVLIASKERPGETLYATNAMLTHCDPKDMPPHPNLASVKLESVKDIKMRNKEGMPYNLLFMNENSLRGVKRFQTTQQAFIEKAPTTNSFSLPDRIKTTERNMTLRRGASAQELNK